MKIRLSIVTSLLLVGVACYAEQALEEVSVTGKKEVLAKQGKMKDVIEKTEVIDKKQIEHKQASTLIEAIQDAPGVDVTTNCSMCGIKRVMINGMKGEHTTVLSDGVPFNSTVSSYYGMDAIGVSDISTIEIARGSGASLTAPEAIGGTMNVVSRSAKKNGAEFDSAIGENGYKVGSILGEAVSSDKKTGIVLSASYSNQNQEDNDNNGVNEAPKLENQIMSIKVSHELTDKDTIDIKASHSNSKVYGGPMVDESTAYALWGASGTANPSFVGGNVNNQYNGDPMGTLEAIDTSRDEVLGKWLHISDNFNVETTLAYAEAKQESMYEGTDYDNKDTIYFGDIKFSTPLNDSHLLTYGIDMKIENMDGTSSQFAPSVGSTGEDDFKYKSYGLYLQDTWSINKNTELNIALRGAKITTDFTGQLAKGNEIDELMVVPRMHLMHKHNDKLTSRLSAGQGYRSPLTFFESEHGLIGPDGFGVEVDKIEKSNNATYSLSYEGDKFNTTGSVSYTNVKNLAYVDDSGIKPTLRNYDGKVGVYNADITGSYKITPELGLSGGFEYYSYDNEYKQLLVIAPIEKQLSFALDYENNGWDGVLQTTWTASRDLTPYGYGDRFNDDALTSPKSTKSPSYFVVDTKLAKKISKNFTLYAGVKNLLNYVQTDDESPLMYDADGGYDVGHIWGPLRGRTAYLGIKATF